jgi:hypothetical protein
MGRRPRNNGLTMTTFHSRQSDCGRGVCKNANVNRFNFASQISSENLHGDVPEARTIRCDKIQDTEQAYAAGLIFYAEQALPLVWTRFLRLAKSSPKLARSPARRSREGCETSGKKSGEISRGISAQRPGNGRTVGKRNAAERPSRRLARQPALRRTCPAMSAPETCETTRNMSTQQPCRSPRNGQCNISQAARGNSDGGF